MLGGSVFLGGGKKCHSHNAAVISQQQGEHCCDITEMHFPQ